MEGEPYKKFYGKKSELKIDDKSAILFSIFAFIPHIVVQADTGDIFFVENWVPFYHWFSLDLWVFENF